MADLDPKALEALKNNQRQLDQDGVFVGVSREALDMLIAAYEGLSALVPTPPPVEAAQEPVAWRNVADAPTVSKGNERLFVVAVRRARTGKVHTFPANYLNAYPLHFDEPCKECPGEGKGCGMEDGDGCPRTGWYTCSEGGEYDYTYSRLLLDPGDEHVGWCEFPSYAAPATGWRTMESAPKDGTAADAVERAYGILWRNTGRDSPAMVIAARKELLTAIPKDGQKRGIEYAISIYGPSTEADAYSIEGGTAKCPQCDFGLGGHEPRCSLATPAKGEA